MTLSITIQEQDLTILTKCVNLSCMKQGLAVMQEAGGYHPHSVRANFSREKLLCVL